MELSDWSRAIEKLYINFVFRDILAYLLPGGLFLYLTSPVIYSQLFEHLCIPQKLYWGMIILFSYAFGRVLQDIGTWLPWPFAWPSKKYRFSLLGIWDYSHPKDYFEKELRFIKKTEEKTFIDSGMSANYRIYRERINLLKLMCGNLTMAFLCSCLVLLFFHHNERQDNLFILFFLVIAFWVSHVDLPPKNCTSYN